MRSKAPERVFILSYLSQIHPQAVQIEYSAQLARLHHIPQSFDSGMIHEQMTGEDRHPPLRPGFGYGLGVLGGEGERLLDQHGLSRFDRLPGHRGMSRRGGG